MTSLCRKKAASVFLSLFLVLALVSGSASAAGAESEKEFMELKNGIIDSFNGERVDLNKDIKVKFKSPDLSLAESAALSTLSLMVKTGAEADRSILTFNFRIFGLGTIYFSIDRSSDGLGLYFPKLDKTYYRIDSDLVDTILQDMAEKLNCGSWEEATEWIKSITLSDMIDQLDDYSELITQNLEVKITATTPSTVEYPTETPVMITTYDQLYEVMEKMSENIPAIFSKE